MLIAVDLGLLESINCVKGWMGGHNDLSALFFRMAMDKEVEYKNNNLCCQEERFVILHFGGINLFDVVLDLLLNNSSNDNIMIQ